MEGTESNEDFLKIINKNLDNYVFNNEVSNL
jgi:hypothetical protein